MSPEELFDGGSRNVKEKHGVVRKRLVNQAKTSNRIQKILSGIRESGWEPQWSDANAYEMVDSGGSANLVIAELDHTIAESDEELGRITWIGNKSGEIANELEASSFIKESVTINAQSSSEDTYTGYLVQDGELTRISSDVDVPGSDGSGFSQSVEPTEPRVDPGKGGSKWFKAGLAVDEESDMFSCVASLAVSFPAVTWACGACVIPEPTSPVSCTGCVLGGTTAFIGAVISCSGDMTGETRYIDRNFMINWIPDNPWRNADERSIQFYHADYGQEPMIVDREVLECEVPTKNDHPSHSC